MNLEHVLAARKNKAIYKYENMAIKVFEEGYPKSSVLNEALNQSRVEETGLRIPKIVSVGITDGKWSISMDYIEGSTLTDLWEKHPEKEKEYLELFVDLQIEMHSKSAPLLNKLKGKLIRKIDTLAEINATTKYELLTQIDSFPKHTKLCHGDFIPSNIIVNNSGAYILDWSHATQGNASADAATTYLKLSLQNATLADEYLKLFCQKSSTSLQYVQQWFPVAAAEQLALGKPSEKEFLLKWLDIIDYQG